VHAETRAGHSARAQMPALIQQTTSLLDHPSTLFHLRSLYLADTGSTKAPTPTEWLNKYVGETKTHAKDGTARYDDGFITAAALDSHHQVLVAFRPAKLQSENDLARLHGILGTVGGLEQPSNLGSIAVIVAVKSAGFQKLMKVIEASVVPAGQWPQNPQ